MEPEPEGFDVSQNQEYNRALLKLYKDIVLCNAFGNHEMSDNIIIQLQYFQSFVYNSNMTVEKNALLYAEFQRYMKNEFNIDI